MKSKLYKNLSFFLSVAYIASIQHLMAETIQCPSVDSFKIHEETNRQKQKIYYFDAISKSSDGEEIEFSNIRDKNIYASSASDYRFDRASISYGGGPIASLVCTYIRKNPNELHSVVLRSDYKEHFHSFKVINGKYFENDDK